MKDFLLIENGKIKLSSGLDEIKFGKTKFSSIISQQGMLFDGENFTPWTFDEVKSFEVSENDNKIVFYCGNSVFSDKAKTLLDYFEDGDREKMFTAAFEVCKALTKAAVEKKSIPIIGAGGIIVDISQEKAKILFLPQTLFINSCAGLSAKDKANLLGCWINETLTDLPAICFLRATIAYTMLTGQFPFPQVDVTERNADILDKKFLPLEMRLPNVPPKLAKEINEALWLTSTRVQLPGKKQTGKASDELTPVADFSLDLLEAERNDIPSAALQKELEEKVKSYEKRRDSKINTKRLIRRNTTTLIVICSAIIVLAFSIRANIKNQKTEYTTKGLTSTQTLVAFLRCVNIKDATMLGNFVHGRNASKYTDIVSQVYVLHKQRVSTAGDNGFAKPENYFLYVTDAYKNQLSGMYGLTNVVIDDVPVELDINIPVKGDNMAPLTEENGVQLANGSIVQHHVEYYLLHTEGEANDILIDYVKEDYTLTFRKDRWVITGIDTSDDELDFNSSLFKIEYFKALKENEGDILKTVKELSFTYPWLPSVYSLQKEQEALKALAEDPFLGIF